MNKIFIGNSIVATIPIIIISSILEEFYYVSIRLVSSYELFNVLLLNFFLYIIFVPFIISIFSMFMFTRKTTTFFVSKKQKVTSIITGAIISYILMLTAQDLFVDTFFWVQEIFMDSMAFFGLVVYIFIFYVSSNVITKSNVLKS